MRPNVALIYAALLVSACSSPERQNPLLEANHSNLGLWATFWGKSNEKLGILDICAQFWFEDKLDQIPSQHSTDCKNLASEIAVAMTENGHGDLVADDVLLAPIWNSYIGRREYQERNKERLRIEQEERDRAFDALGIPKE